MMTSGFQQDMMERILSSNPDMPDEVRDMMERAATGAAFGALIMLTNFVLSVIFGTLGGLLGVAIFKKNAPPPPGTVEVLPPVT
jgi:hypothetical protein